MKRAHQYESYFNTLYNIRNTSRDDTFQNRAVFFPQGRTPAVVLRPYKHEQGRKLFFYRPLISKLPGHRQSTGAPVRRRFAFAGALRVEASAFRRGEYITSTVPAAWQAVAGLANNIYCVPFSLHIISGIYYIDLVNHWA
jgi:hypothetical protein